MKGIKNTLLYIIGVSFLCGCNGGNTLPEGLNEQYTQTRSVMDECASKLSNYQSENNLKDYLMLYELNKQLEFSYLGEELTEKQYQRCVAHKRSVDSMRNVLNKFLKDELPQQQYPIYSHQDLLVNSSLNGTFYAKRDERVNMSFKSDRKFSLKLYNADTREVIYSAASTNEVNENLGIHNSAIYLFELNTPTPLYADIDISRTVNSPTDFFELNKIVVDTVPCEKNDFRAQCVQGVSMKSAFEEPRKITLRSQIKAAFSGSNRSVVALQIPQGCTDVLYSLRISTSDRSQSGDGTFADRVDQRYHEIRFMGLPLYESTRSNNSIFRELLLATKPNREEEAYCSMYVYTSAAEARKFQNDDILVKDTKFNLDYSIVGTQSCNGRIPAAGYKTIYLGFENPKSTSSVYIWLEALTVVKTTECFKEKYTVKKTSIEL